MSDGTAPPAERPEGTADAAAAVAPVGARARQRAADRWFREQGLPTFVPLRRWFTDLPRRVAPLLTAVTLTAALLEGVMVTAIDAAADLLPDDEWALLGIALLLLAGIAVIAWAGFRLVRAALRRLSAPAGAAVAGVVIAACLIALVVVGYLMRPGAKVAPVIEGLALVAACMLVTGAGGGALLSWGSRLAVRNVSAIGHMASIALPVILMLVVFAFFSAEVWQMSSALPWGSIALIGAVVAALALIVVLRVCASEIDEIRQTLTPEERTALLARTPIAHDGSGSASSAPLRFVQRFNVMLVMAVAQLMQAVLFAAMLWALLVLIGGIAIPVGIVELWVGPGTPAHPLHVDRLMIGGATLPITMNLVKTAAVMSIISSLPFVLSAVSEQRYRERFFDPIMVDMRRAIVVRDVLMARTRGGRASG
ncbi:hypothetical protein [Microbacterium azadirachtae]|uniref:Integral membrane protein n=1 Tax=Microbacterium azadirachtae TaxID=582680 RepID=A0A0F0LQS2_9MICO|nr:hypothetical protein [Microbacterium azadirachtae]KJL33871.1 hypothetical protein RS86_01307 [Microbacterium azadirachtae]